MKCNATIGLLLVLRNLNCLHPRNFCQQHLKRMSTAVEEILHCLGRLKSYGGMSGVGKCPTGSHHPTIKGISSPTDICFGDLLNKSPNFWDIYLPTPGCLPPTFQLLLRISKNHPTAKKKQKKSPASELARLKKRNSEESS